MTTTFLIVPGYTNSGAEHWQSWMERKYHNVVRVAQDDWHNPHRQTWLTRLDDTIRSIQHDIVLVGHSCGAVAVAQWAAAHHRPQVVAAILVAPADVDAELALGAIRQQGPLPDGRLPLPTLLIYSDNDNHLSSARACQLAANWGSDIRMISNGGHINTESGHGEWLAGEAMISRFSGRELVSKRSEIAQ